MVAPNVRGKYLNNLFGFFLRIFFCIEDEWFLSITLLFNKKFKVESMQSKPIKSY